MSAVVVGASSGIGRALAAELARRGNPLLLVASDADDLDALAADLRLRHGIEVRTLALDLAREPDPGARIAAALDGMPPLKSVLLAAGWSRAGDDGTLGAAAAGDLLAVNLHAPIAITQALLPPLSANRGTLVALGSVAAVRGRRRNVVYAAAKRGLESFCESLRHGHPPRAPSVQCWRLGFVATNLTFGAKLPLPAADPVRLARIIVDQLGRGSFRRALPRWWGIVGLAVRLLPWPIFRRIDG